jgi:hypothetical protein
MRADVQFLDQRPDSTPKEGRQVDLFKMLGDEHVPQTETPLPALKQKQKSVYLRLR